MASTEPRPELDEQTRSFMAAVLPKLPESVTELMLADSGIRASLGLLAGENVRVFGSRFLRAELFRCLRELANDRPADLQSVDGSVTVKKGELNPSGAAILTVGSEGALFANVGMLSESRERRLATLDHLIGQADLPQGEEVSWRATLEQRSLDDAEYVALEEMLSREPQAVYREMAADAAEGLSLQALVPEEEELFGKLLCTAHIPGTLAEYRESWLKHVEGIQATRLAGALAFAAPLAVLRGRLIPLAAREVSREERLSLARFLLGAPDPASVVAAFQIAADNVTDPDFKAVGDTALNQIADATDPRLISGAVLVTSALVLTTAVSARRRTLAAWPGYARRLSWFLHASHLTRTFGNGQVDHSELSRLVRGATLLHARLVDLVDAQASPFNLMAPLTPTQIFALGLNRAQEAVAELSSEERPEHWVLQIDEALQAAAKADDSLLLLAPAPFDPFEQDWEGLFQLPPDGFVATLGRLDADNPDEAVGDLMKLAFAFEVGEDQRSTLAEKLPDFVTSLPDALFVPVVEMALQLAARWRDTPLSDALIQASLSRFAKADADADRSAAPRFALLAGASSADPAEWARRVGEYTANFAFAMPPGSAINSLANALDLIRDYAPALQGPLAVSRSYTILAQDRLPRKKQVSSGEVAGSPPEGADETGCEGSLGADGE